MVRPGIVIACFCIACLPLSGCYSSVTLDPDGKKLLAASGNDIEYLVTKDGTTYTFDTDWGAPAILKDVVRGWATVRPPLRNLVIPFSETARVGESRSGYVEYIIMKDGTRHDFDIPPAIVDRTYVGIPRAKKSDVGLQQNVAIPLTDIAEVFGKEFELGQTVSGAIGTGLIVTAVGSLVLLLLAMNSL